jgi:hypothetical protein
MNNTIIKKELKHTPAEVLYNIMRHKRQTYQRCAKRIGITNISMSKYINQCTTLHRRQKWKLAKALDIEIDILERIISGEMSFLDWLNYEFGKLRGILW